MEQKLESILVKVAHTLGVDEPLREYQIVTAGHINDTYRVKFGDVFYTMQRVNRYVFKKHRIINPSVNLAAVGYKRVFNICAFRNILRRHTRSS